MGHYGYDDIRIDFDDALGSATNMTSYIKTFNGIEINMGVEEATPPGVAWEAQDFAGFKAIAEVTLEGWYDDTAATGPKVVFDAVGSATTRTLKVTWGGGKYSSVETFTKSYNEVINKKGITTFQVVLRPTGAVTEA